jgi:phosphatidylserine/phosphatidylglycerophosphate/cardiolipin synthase-like enzyme
MLGAITSAVKVLIVSPYFLPGRKHRRELREAAIRGVGAFCCFLVAPILWFCN